MIEIQITCSACGRKRYEAPIVLENEAIDILPENLLMKIFNLGWIVEHNGNHLDTYCSKECAK